MGYTREERDARFDQLIARLRETDGRVTPQRMAVIRALTRNENHLNAEDVYREIQPTFPTMSIATVYKTIDKFKGLGEVLELEIRGGSTRYDMMRPTPHSHLVCTDCRKTLDLDLDLPKEQAELAARKLGFELQGIRLDLYGVCRECRGK